MKSCKPRTGLQLPQALPSIDRLYPYLGGTGESNPNT
jgi:hypothetical protein